MKAFFLLLFSVTFLLSQDLMLDDLLAEYESSESLYHETKKESAGHIILFSRSDLDKMQAFTLNDILKTLRMYNAETIKTGMTTLVKSGNGQVGHTPVKIFINSYELNSATLGNALTQYGKMSLYFIDHIEIYQAGNSVMFGNEPGSMIIKLYTKEPSRENATSTQASIDTRASLKLQALEARAFDEYSYLASVDVSQNNYETYNTNSSELSRDGHRGQVYLQFSKKESYDIEVGATHEKFNSFSGLGNAPTDGNIDAKNFYIQVTKHFKNELKVIVSASTEKLSVLNEDSVGIQLADGSTTNKLDISIGTNVYSAIVEKRFIHGANDLFLGAHFKHQKFNINEYKTDGLSPPRAWGPTELNIYMAYLENLYNINENNLIALSAKVDHYENDFSKSSTESILRLGYIAILNKSLRLKLFAMKSYMYPIFRQTTFSANTYVNPDLKSSTSKTLTAEMIYNINKTTVTLGAGGGEVDNAIVFSQVQKKYINNDETGSFQRVYARVDHVFDHSNKLTLEYFKMYKEVYASPGNGGLIQLFNKIGKFDIYNELVYRSDYTSSDGIDMPAGYDYSLGVIYPVNRRLEVKLKGENLLDLAHAVPINGVEVPLMERRGLLTMEYTF